VRRRAAVWLLAAVAGFAATAPRAGQAGSDPMTLPAGVAADAGEPASPGNLQFDAPDVDVVECYQFDVLDEVFTFSNRGTAAVRVSAVHAADPAAEAAAEPDVVPPGGRGRIRVRQPVGPRLGLASFRFVAVTDDAAKPRHDLELRAFVQSAYDPELPVIDFGIVDRATGATREIEVGSREVDTLELEEVAAAPAHVEVRPVGRAGVAGERLRLAITVKPGAPEGWQVATVRLLTNVTRQRDYLAALQASVYGDVVPSESPLRLGAVRQGQRLDASLRLTSRSGTAFEVLAIEDPGGRWAADVAPCEGGSAPRTCWTVGLRSIPASTGGLRGVLDAVLSDGRRVPVAYEGLVVSPDAVLHQLGEVGPGTLRRLKVGTEEDTP